MRARFVIQVVVLVSAAGCAGTNHHFVRDAYERDVSCPGSKVVVLNFLGNDKRRGNQWQAYGCDQRRTCFDNNARSRWECRWPDDLVASAAQVRLMMNCPTESMQPVAYNEAKKGPTLDDDGGDWDWPGGSWRIEGCGAAFVCTATETNQVACQQAPQLSPQVSPLAPLVPLDPPPPPPPPES